MRGLQRKRSTLDNHHLEYFYFPHSSVASDLELSISSGYNFILSLLKRRKSILPRSHGLKFQIRIQILLVKFSFELDRFIRITPWFISENFSLFNKTNIAKHLDDAFSVCIGHLDNFVQTGSGWVIKKVKKISIIIMRYKLFSGSCSLKELPSSLSKKKGLIVLRNTEQDKCFLYAVSAALCQEKKNSTRLKKIYKEILSVLPAKFMMYPVTIKEIQSFEKVMPISVNVYGYHKILFPYYVSEWREKKYHVDLLLHQNHYYAIKEISSLITCKVNRRKTYVCRFCLSYFVNYKRYLLHEKLCLQECQQIILPTKDEAFLKFKAYKSKIFAPFIIYADLETAILPPVLTNTNKGINKRNHVPIASCFYTVCTVRDNLSQKKPFLYVGLDCIDVFFSELEKEFVRISSLKNELYVPIIMTKEDKVKFSNQLFCEMCGKFFSKTVEKVRDHCHLTGKYRLALCSNCNFTYAKTDFDVLVVFHGLNNYDQHFLIPKLYKYANKARIRIIPRNNQKFLSFAINNLVFKDSHEFLAGSLANLVKDLKSKGEKYFYHVNKFFKNTTQRNYLYRKGVFPYNYITDINVLRESSLPLKDYFYNDLSKSIISDEDYSFAIKVWNIFSCNTLEDYLKIYLLADVLLLADVFENFRITSFFNYNLDPAHFVSNAQYTLNAFLNYTHLELELLTDVNKYFYLVRGIRGGVSMVCKRFSEANNKYLNNYDKDKPSKYIFYIDCNNLYGKAMLDPLPYKNFRWMKKDEFNLQEILDTSVDSDVGYILECTLVYPKSLHDKHKDFPLAPEKIKIPFDKLSMYAQMICLQNKLKASTNSEKLSCTFRDKNRYILHYRTLQLYLKLGLQLKYIHNILVFKQKRILKDYILLNTQKRTEATNSFDVNYFKLMCNSLYGKTMERPDKRTKVKLVSDCKKYEKIVSDLNFKNGVYINKKLVSLQSKHAIIKVDKPFYLGMSILDISKLYMFSFHYEIMQKIYSYEKLQLLYTDTDSFIYEIETDDLFDDLKKYTQYFDFSNYSENHDLYSVENKKKPGFFKDECAGNIIKSFVGLRSKMYSIKMDNDLADEYKIAKGVSRSVIANDLTFQNYVDCLFGNNQVEHSFSSIQSKDHKVFTGKQNKICLSPFDDKRFLLNNIDTLPYAHYKTLT